MVQQIRRSSSSIRRKAREVAKSAKYLW
nr:hypothetical protein [Geminocystis sp. NIES-3709]